MTISDMIERDLRERARTPGGLPDPLTLSSMSSLYGVSLTPVRLAVKMLVDDRILRKCANGRIEADPSAAIRPAATSPIVPMNAAVDIDSLLGDEVIRLGLAGREARVREEETADRLGVGRTVLRQALHRLAGKGLIVHLPRRGWVVRPCDEADLAAYLVVREALELKAMDLARPGLEDRDLRRMLRGNRPGPDARRLDNDIHKYLVEKSGNRHIREFFDRQGAYYTALLDYATPEARVTERMARQHRAILRALIDRDWPRARRALAAHIRAQLPVVRDLIRGLHPRIEGPG